MREQLVLLLMFAAASFTLPAATMVERTGDTDTLCCQFDASAFSWTQTTSWNDVRIEVTLHNLDHQGDPHTGVFLLTNSLGPGTTEAANEIADTVVQVAGQGDHDVTAFQGLTLGPGTYHLVYWRVSGTPTQLLAMALRFSPAPFVLGAGISNVQLSWEDQEAPYRPASTFSTVPNNGALIRITGTQVLDPTPVPEPGTFVVSLAAGAVLVVVQRFRSGSLTGEVRR